MSFYEKVKLFHIFSEKNQKIYGNAFLKTENMLYLRIIRFLSDCRFILPETRKKIHLHEKGVFIMENARYQVVRIDGDYAVLRRLDEADAAEIPVARALLPPEIREGSHLLREFLEYSILEE